MFTYLPEHTRQYIITANILLLQDLNIDDKGANLHGDQGNAQCILIVF